MIKRKERIERWRAERKMKDMELQKKPPEKPVSANSHKTWSLEDDEEDDEVKIIEIEDSPTRVVKEELKEPPLKKIEKIVIDDDDDDDSFKMKMESSKKKAIAKLPIEPEKNLKTEDKVKVQDFEKSEIEKVDIQEEEEDDDIDPLDAFMKGVDEEVRKINKMAKVSSAKTPGQTGLVIVTGNAKKQQKEIKKGELIEQNQDGLEYSSEEEFEDIKDTAANLAIKQKKELPKIDHSTMNYSDFKKNFYVEVPEIAKMTQQEVEAYRTELEDIQVKGEL